TIDSAKDVGTSAYETASRIRHGYMQTLNSYIGQPTLKYANYLWEKFPPVRWLVYTLAALNSIPLAAFIGWSILTFGVVTALAGVGIVVSQGFFMFLGFAVFIPVSFCLLCLAGIWATIATGLWASLGVANFGLVQLGVVKNPKNLYGPKRIAEAGIHDRDANR
ncbi:7175_t:CDS:1, partial [Dentiscutata erythropus]